MKFDLVKVGDKLVSKTGKLGLKIKAHSPEILLVVGIGTMVGAVVTAAIASKKQDDIAEDHMERVKKVKEEAEEEVKKTNEETGEEETVTVTKDEKQLAREIRREYGKTVMQEVKCWAPTVGLMIVSTGCFVGMHNIQSARIAGLSTAYAGLQDYIHRYEANNIALNGQESHEMCKNGFKTVKETDENGNTTEKKVMKTAEEVAEEMSDECSGGTWTEWCYTFSYETAPATYIKNASSQFNINHIRSCIRGAEVVKNTGRGFISVDDLATQIGIVRSKEQIARDREFGFFEGGEPIDLGLDDPINNPALSGRGNTPIILRFNPDGNINYILRQQAKKEKEIINDLKTKRDAEVKA